MNVTNPYQPRRSKSPLTAEQKFASRLVSLRDKPLTLGTIYWMQARVLAVQFVFFVLAITYFAWFQLQPGIDLMLGCHQIAQPRAAVPHRTITELHR